MDALSRVALLGIAELVTMGSLSTGVAEVLETDAHHRRWHTRAHAQATSHVRADYPVIFSWLTAQTAVETETA